ncbi:MAG: hypothetical protein Q8Q09_02220 [Deltaproteobacteria bacterium]|nr:hypothetical protein [Deltaproteobacteria bacterium]
MSTIFKRWMSGVLLATGAVACSPPPVSMDVTGADAAMDAVGEASVDAMPQPRVCEMANVVNLATAGMRMGSTVRYTGTTAMAANNAMIAIPASCIQGGMVIRQVAHTYTAMAAGFLRVTTNLPGTPAGMGGHDTVVWIQDRCDTRGTMSLGCNDDSGGVIASTVVSNRLVMAGQTVTIVVGTLAMAAGGPGMAYELSIEELPPIMVGGECDPSQVDRCVEGNTCVGAGQIGRCVVNGSLAAQCRAMDMCDMGLECIDVSATAKRCLRRATAGGACNGLTVCPEMSDCTDDGMMPNSSVSGRCRARGTEGGLCGGSGGAMCTAPLVCTGDAMRTGTCVREVAAMAACDPTGVTTRCAMGNSCSRGAMGFVCSPNGTASGTACLDGAMRCTGAMLTCTTAMMAGVCQSTLAAGAMCDARFGSNKCAGTEVCAALGNATGEGTCTAAVNEAAGMNDTPAMAEAARALPLVIRGAITPMTDRDCYSVTLPASSTLLMQVSDGAGGCPTGADSIVSVYDSMGRFIAGNDDAFNLCSYLDMRENPFTRMLPAGNYAVCVNAYQGMTAIMSYALSVRAVPSAP